MKFDLRVVSLQVPSDPSNALREIVIREAMKGRLHRTYVKSDEGAFLHNAVSPVMLLYRLHGANQPSTSLKP